MLCLERRFSAEGWQFDSMRRYSGFLGCGVYLPPGYSQPINQTVYVGVENVRAGKFNCWGSSTKERYRNDQTMAKERH